MYQALSRFGWEKNQADALAHAVGVHMAQAVAHGGANLDIYTGEHEATVTMADAKGSLVVARRLYGGHGVGHHTAQGDDDTHRAENAESVQGHEQDEQDELHERNGYDEEWHNLRDVDDPWKFREA